MPYALELVVAVSAWLMRWTVGWFGGASFVARAVLRMASLVACPPSAQRLFLAVLWMATTHNLGRGRWAGAERQVLLSAPGRGRDGLVVSLGSNMA